MNQTRQLITDALDANDTALAALRRVFASKPDKTARAIADIAISDLITANRQLLDALKTERAEDP